MRYLYIFLIMIFGASTLVFIALFLERLQYSYNENGNYFSSEGVIYQKQSMEVLGGLTFITAVITIVILVLFFKLKKNK